MDIFKKRLGHILQDVILEEGMFSYGDDNSMYVSVPGDLPVGQDVKVEDSDIDDSDHV